MRSHRKTLSRGGSRPRKGSRGGSAGTGRGRLESAGVAEAVVGVLLLAVALVVVPTARDPFRLPKLMAAEWLALASLLPLAWRLRRVEAVRASTLWRSPAVRVAAPILLIATAGWLLTPYRPVVGRALADLWIGAAVLVGWSLGLPAERLRRLLSALLIPGVLLALLAILQFHDLFRPFEFGGGEESGRLGVTSLAGNPGDLAGLLALAGVVAQAELLRRRGGLRTLTAAALVVIAYALALTQTLSGLAAFLFGSLVLWAVVLPGRRLAGALAGLGVASLIAVLAIVPLRERLVDKGQQLARGDVNAVLTGRLDGWRVATHLLAERPWAGVGHGAYSSAFARAKLAMLDEGKEFFRGQHQVMFANAHNEVLEAGAEWGLPGLAALGWGIFVSIGAARRLGAAAVTDSAGRGLAWSGLAVLAILSLTHFPFRLALTAYPALLWLAWVLQAGRPREGEAR